MYTTTIQHPNKSHPRFVGNDRKKIIRLYKSGKSAQQVADRMNADKKTILHLLRQEGVIRTAAKSKTLDLPQDEIVRLYVEDGLSAREIGKQFGTDTHTILSRLRSWDVDIVKIRQPLLHEINIDEIAEMYANGMTTETIADAMNVSPSVIQRRLNSRGLIEPRTGMGIPHESLNGEMVRSSFELSVANWLYDHDISYDYEPQIGGTRFMADFKVGDYFIEVCGMYGMDNDRFGYDDRLRQKEELYERHGLDYVLLFPSAINDADLHRTFSQPWISNSIKEINT